MKVKEEPKEEPEKKEMEKEPEVVKEEVKEVKEEKKPVLESSIKEEFTLPGNKDVVPSQQPQFSNPSPNPKIIKQREEQNQELKKKKKKKQKIIEQIFQTKLI